MATLGVDSQIILDGNGYYVEPRTYSMKWIRLRKSAVTKGGQERYTDLGPGKRLWHMILLCLNNLPDYTGAPLPATGVQLRNQLVTSYGEVNTVSYTDLDGRSTRCTSTITRSRFATHARSLSRPAITSLLF